MRTALAFTAALALAGCMPPSDPNPPPPDDSPDLAGAAPGSGKFAADGGGQAVTLPDGGKLPYLAACSTNDQCESGICNAYPAKGGSFCVNACMPATEAQDCPPPSTGCNKMGFCKVP